QAVLIRGEIADLEVVETHQVVNGFQDRGMLQRGGNDVSTPRVGQRDALDSEVVGLSATGGEDHLRGTPADHPGHHLARRLQARRGRPADAVGAGRVAEVAGQVRPHGLECFSTHPCGRRIVQVDHYSKSSPRSRARTEWVRAPTEMTSTPVRAMSATVSRLTPPEASTIARPATILMPSRRSSLVKLSSMMVSTPAASTGSI